ncbi:hypothetical protein FRB96_006804 [Tulasnella sp. 330]|nr:hypothetical protein FRB96_006804 [Tulasnella sp. 330]
MSVRWSDPKPSEASRQSTAPVTTLTPDGGSMSRRRSSSSTPSSHDHFFVLPFETTTIPATYLPPLIPATSTHPVPSLGMGVSMSAKTTTTMVLLTGMTRFPQDTPNLFVLGSDNSMLEGGATYAWPIVEIAIFRTSHW